ncbi:MAG: TetR/AcrR family transcriptional regulator [Anaerolineales bacterium]|nr:TetR/AcrR family transcriptional regulator [Anaerolineales bacterium]
MTPKPDVSAERKHQIHQAAMSCFASKGYHLTTMDDIAGESGLSKGTLYWYFDSKKALFLSLFQEMMGGFEQTWAPIMTDEKLSATDKLRTTLDFFRTELEAFLPFFGVMMEAWVLIRRDEDVEQLMHDFYEPYAGMMAQVLEQGIQSGEFQVSSKNPMALVILTLYDGITLAIGTGLWQEDWDQIMDAAEQLVLNGLGVTRD